MRYWNETHPKSTKARWRSSTCLSSGMCGDASSIICWYSSDPFTSLCTFVRWISILMVLVPQGAHIRRPLYSRFPFTIGVFFCKLEGDTSGWQSLTCLERLTTDAVQLPTTQFFLALFCKIDNRNIMPHEYYKQQCATFIDNYSLAMCDIHWQLFINGIKYTYTLALVLFGSWLPLPLPHLLWCHRLNFFFFFFILWWYILVTWIYRPTKIV